MKLDLLLYVVLVLTFKYSFVYGYGKFLVYKRGNCIKYLIVLQHKLCETYVSFHIRRQGKQISKTTQTTKVKKK